MSYDTRFRPQIGHWTEHTVIFQNGSLGTTLHVAGQNSELMDEAALEGARENLNQLALSSTNPRLQWWQHFTRIGHQRAPVLPPCKTWWAQSFDQAVDRHCMGGIYRNDLFFTLLVRPRDDVAISLRRAWRAGKDWLFGRKRLALPSATDLFLEEFEDTVSKTMNALRHLTPVRLGFRRDETTGVWHSAVWEAHHLIGNGFFRPIPLCAGTERAGRQVIPVRPVFGHRSYQLLTEGHEQHGAILGLVGYPAGTHPLMHQKLHAAHFDLTIGNVLLFTQTQKAVGRIDFKQKQMDATQDARTQSKQLAERKDDLQSNLVAYGRHTFWLTVRARSQPLLDRAVWEAEEMAAQGRATVVRYDSKALKAGFYTQYPGNARWSVRRAGLSSRNFAGFAALNNVPTGTPRSRWGAPFFYLRTTRDTLFPYHLHVIGDPNIPAEDVASWFTVGGMGSGKTSHNARKIVAAQRVGARSIVFDKDCGLAPAILANDGDYLVLEDGEESGVAPLLALSDTPADRAHLYEFLLGLIESDDRGPVSTSDDAALASAIQFQMGMPPELRAIDGIWPLLDDGPTGAGPRLRKWSRSGTLGWAFDGRHDRVGVLSPLLGFDTTALLKNKQVCEPMLTHLFYRIQGIVYQRRPLVIMMDECWKTIGDPETTGVAMKEEKAARFVATFNDHSKTIRKNEGAIGLITQSASDLLASAMARTIQQNMPTKEFFGDRDAQWVDLGEGFSLTPREFHIVKRVLPSMRHAMLVKRPDGSFIARNDMSGIGDKVAVLSGRRATYDLALALREKYGEASRLWVPHYERLAPLMVADPKLDPHDLVEGRTAHVKERLPA